MSAAGMHSFEHLIGISDRDKNGIEVFIDI